MPDGRRVRMTAQARTARAASGGVEVAGRVVEADTWRLLLEFAEPRTVAEVAAGVEGGVQGLVDPVETLIRWGLLEPVPDHGPPDADDGGGECLRDRLAPELRDPALLARIAGWLRDRRAVAIPDALDPDLAEEVHAALSSHRDWRALEVAQPFFHYRTHHLDDEARFPEPLRRCRRLFASAATKRFAAELTGTDTAGLPTFAASWYQPGEYSLPHSDAGQNRSVAFVWHLTRDWDPTFGGEFYWCPTGRALTPSFNCLTLFRVWAGSTHLVCPVGLHAVGKRLAVAGWWTSTAREWGGPEISPTGMSAHVEGYAPPGGNDRVDDPRVWVF